MSFAAFLYATPAFLYETWIVSVIGQGVPEPFDQGPGSFVTYTPPAGPRSSILLDSRPEVVARQYVLDYLQLAGTYPCATDLSAYSELTDPLLRTGHCVVKRPVASFAVTSVTIETNGIPSNFPTVARVSISVLYRDGSQWKTNISMEPDKYGGPFPLMTHLTCWSSFGSYDMFSGLSSTIPPGAEYSTGGAENPQYHCKP